MRKGRLGWRRRCAGVRLRAPACCCRLRGRAQTEIEKIRRRQTCRPRKARSRRAYQDDGPDAAPRPRGTTGWSAGGQRPRRRRQPRPRSAATTARTRFSLVLSAAVPYQYFTLADPYRLIIDMPDVNFQPAQGLGPAGARADPGLPLRPVRAGQVAHRHRHQAAGARRAGGRWRAGPGARRRASTSISLPDRPGELPGQAGAAGTACAKEARGHDQDRPRPAEGHAKPGRSSSMPGHGGRRSRRGQRRGDREGRGARGCPASAHHPGGQGPLRRAHDARHGRVRVARPAACHLAARRGEPVHLHPCRHAWARRSSRRACAARPSTRSRSGLPASRRSCWPTRRTPPTSWPARESAPRGGARSGQEHPDRPDAARDVEFLGRLPQAPAVAPEADDRAVPRSGPLGSVQGPEAAPVALGAGRARLHEQCQDARLLASPDWQRQVAPFDCRRRSTSTSPSALPATPDRLAARGNVLLRFAWRKGPRAATFRATGARVSVSVLVVARLGSNRRDERDRSGLPCDETSADPAAARPRPEEAAAQLAA